MATQQFKIASNNAEFPFLYARAGRSVLSPGNDVAPRTSTAFTGTVKSFDWNLIKMIYCENVLPIAEGLISTGTLEEIAPISPPETDFDQFVVLRDEQERNYLMVPARGKNYVLNASTLGWESKNAFTWDAGKKIVSRAYVGGRTFVLYERDRLIEWDPVLEVFNTITLTLPAGYSITDIRTCTGASNYLVLTTQSEVLWSSLTDLTNFVDNVNGAGRQTPIDLKGQITTSTSISGGFVLYTTRNAVAAFFTNDAATPFTFREIQGSGGVATYEHITAEANQAEHYTYGSSGLQVVTLQRAEIIHPDCADFLSQRQYESWNSATGLIEVRELFGALEVKLHLLANRYLCISYGKIDGQFTYALFFDFGLQRWGKVRVNHVDVTVLPSTVVESFWYRYFELLYNWEAYDVMYQDLEGGVSDILPLRQGFAFLQNTGAIRVLQSEMASGATEGVAIFGHVQVTRSRAVTFLGADLEGLYDDPIPVVRIMGSNVGDGYTRLPAIATYTAMVTPRQMQVKGDNVFENFDLVVEGKFSLTTAIIKTMTHGSY